MSDTVEEITFTVAADGEEETLTVPRKLVEMLGEEGERPPDTVASLAMLSLANRVHHLSHHQEGEPDPELAAIESATMDRFEERFGVTFAEATGHDH